MSGTTNLHTFTATHNKPFRTVGGHTSIREASHWNTFFTVLMDGRIPTIDELLLIPTVRVIQRTNAGDEKDTCFEQLGKLASWQKFGGNLLSRLFVGSYYFIVCTSDGHWYEWTVEVKSIPGFSHRWMDFSSRQLFTSSPIQNGLPPFNTPQPQQPQKSVVDVPSTNSNKKRKILEYGRDLDIMDQYGSSMNEQANNELDMIFNNDDDQKGIGSHTFYLDNAPHDLSGAVNLDNQDCCFMNEDTCMDAFTSRQESVSRLFN